MRKLLSAVILGLMVGSTAGCIIPAYSGDPPRRTDEMITTSENLRLLLDEWERIWFLDEPSHTTPLRVDGGLM